MTKQESTKQDINKLIEFGEAIYENGMLLRKDALFDVLDALLSAGSVSSFAKLSHIRAPCLEALDIVAVDGKYGNSGFLRAVKGLRNDTVARLRSGRVLYRPPHPPTGKRGRPRVHGERFAFKESQTWGDPDEMLTLEDEHFGNVRLERWNGLHEKKGSNVPYDIVRASVHLERDKPPHAIWLAWMAPPSLQGSASTGKSFYSDARSVSF